MNTAAKNAAAQIARADRQLRREHEAISDPRLRAEVLAADGFDRRGCEDCTDDSACESCKAERAFDERTGR